MNPSLGQLIRSFFEDYLKVQRGLRPASIRSYRDAVRLFLDFVVKDARSRISRLALQELTFERTERFLRHLEEERHNHPRSRNQRLAALRTLFEYLGTRVPEMIACCEQVSLIPIKRSAPRETHYLDQKDISTLFSTLPVVGRHALRDRTLLLFLYNTGARVQEVADLQRNCLQLDNPPRVRLYGKGGKWRTCPLWEQTAKQLRELLTHDEGKQLPESAVFQSRPGHPLTRFGIYKIVRRCAGHLDITGNHPRHVSPHLFRHTAAVHLLESGVEINVIRGWLGHVSLESTNRYAEITVQLKEAAVKACEPMLESWAECRPKVDWRKDELLLDWLASL